MENENELKRLRNEILRMEEQKKVIEHIVEKSTITWYVLLKNKHGNVFWTTDDGSDHEADGCTVIQRSVSTEEMKQLWLHHVFGKSISEPKNVTFTFEFTEKITLRELLRATIKQLDFFYIGLTYIIAILVFGFSAIIMHDWKNLLFGIVAITFLVVCVLLSVAKDVVYKNRMEIKFQKNAEGKMVKVLQKRSNENQDV